MVAAAADVVVLNSVVYRCTHGRIVVYIYTAATLSKDLRVHFGFCNFESKHWDCMCIAKVDQHPF